MDGLDECTDENAQAEIIEMYLIFLNVELSTTVIHMAILERYSDTCPPDWQFRERL